MTDCPKCGFAVKSEQECPSCGVVFSKFLSASVVRRAPGRLQDDSESQEGKGSIYRESLLTTAVALPASLLFVPIAKLLVLPAMILDGVKIWIHEFGHAFVAWLSGRAATPLGIGWTNTGLEFSWVVLVCFSFLLGVTIYKSIESRTYFPALLAAVLVPFLIYFSFLSNPRSYEIAMAFGGVGGQFYLAALLVIAFFYRFPEAWRWDVARYLFLVAGMYCLVDTLYEWIQISNNEAPIPWGTLIHGEQDGGGDMNRLYAETGWLKKELIAVYVKTGWLCVAAVALNYAYFLTLAFLRKDKIEKKQAKR